MIRTGFPVDFNIWRWILPQLTTSERGGRRGSVKPEAVLKSAFTPIAMRAGLWDELRQDWEKGDDPRPPVLMPALASLCHGARSRWSRA